MQLLTDSSEYLAGHDDLDETYDFSISACFQNSSLMDEPNNSSLVFNSPHTKTLWTLGENLGQTDKNETSQQVMPYASKYILCISPF